MKPGIKAMPETAMMATDHPASAASSCIHAQASHVESPNQITLDAIAIANLLRTET